MGYVMQISTQYPIWGGIYWFFTCFCAVHTRDIDRNPPTEIACHRLKNQGRSKFTVNSIEILFRIILDGLQFSETRCSCSRSWRFARLWLQSLYMFTSETRARWTYFWRANCSVGVALVLQVDHWETFWMDCRSVPIYILQNKLRKPLPTDVEI